MGYKWVIRDLGYKWVTARAGQLAWLWSCGQVAYRIVSDGGFTYEVRVAEARYRLNIQQ